MASTQSGALNLDGLRSSHPIQVPIARGDAVMEIFDAISYSKGSSVIRMVYATLGHKHFQDGIRNYMIKHRYGNTETLDLWRAWEQVSGMEISQLMSGWTEKMGYPLLMVSKIEKRGDIKVEGEILGIDISQKWYLADNSTEVGDETAQWIVPLLIATSEHDKDYCKSPSNVKLMKEKNMTMALDACRWVKLNARQWVPMRVQYSDELLNCLTNAIRMGELCSEDRIGLLGDTFQLCKSGHYSDVSAVIKLLSAYKNERNANVYGKVSAALDGLDFFFSMADDGADTVLELASPNRLYAWFKRFAGSLLDGPLNALGWNHRPQDTDLTKQMRGQVIQLAASFRYDDPSIRVEANRRFNAWVDDPNTPLLPDDYKAPVFEIVLQDPQNLANAFETLLDLMANSPSLQISHRSMIRRSLGKVPDMGLKRRYLDLLIPLSSDPMDSIVKLQDISVPFASVSGSGKAGNDLAWQWIQQNWDTLWEKRKAWESSLLRDCVTCACIGSSKERAEGIAGFFTPERRRMSPQIDRTIKQAIEKTQLNAAFVLRVKSSPTVGEQSFWEQYSI